MTTETEMKLRDAAAQMRIALANVADDEVVRSCVNSYISAARSVTFVMQRESSDHPELLAWYVDEMSALNTMPLLRFFNEQRVYSIHKGVVSPRKFESTIHNLTINGVVSPGEGTMSFLRFDGAEKYFPGGSGNVFRLCEQYFLVVKGLVGNWLKKRGELGIT